MILLYSEQPAERWYYVADVLLRQIAGIPISFTHQQSEFREYGGPKINYSHYSITDKECLVIPDNLLFESGIAETVIEVFDTGRFPAFFGSPGGDLPFDIFAASFYLLTRYEEYLPHDRDGYGRYAHTNSIAFRENFLGKPLVNIWVETLKEVLRTKFGGLFFGNNRFRFQPTYDIDVAYSFLNKGLLRNTGGMIRSLIRGEMTAIQERVKVLSGKTVDPYNVYEYLYALHLRYGLKPYYFFLLAKEPRGYDRNVDPTSEDLVNLIRFHAMGYDVGLHPSWQSGDVEGMLEEEKAYLESVTGKKVVNSRQHYIRFNLPQTFRRLINAGIEHEFSMGYGSINGFRASVSSPYTWYDLEREEKTGLVIHPFCFMDANSFYEQKFLPQQAFEELKYYHDIVKRYNGTLVTIWHNQFFSASGEFAGWKEVYELFIREIVYWDL